MAKQNLKVRSGNLVVVMMDGQPVGLAQNVRASDDYGHEAASGIGDIHPVEHVPTQARHSITVSKMVLSQESIRERGVFTENGDDALEGRVFDIVKMDKATGQALVTYVSCSFVSGDTDISKHSISMSSGQFLALDRRGKGI